MDPTTTLFTFMLQTHPSVKQVHLVGSWDNFTRAYTMERDSRRDRGQWRGCYAFKDIVCDGDAGSIPKRNGGLKMGQTYYYYYELDGAAETHDPSQPSTNTCLYLPGQTVNTLWIPVEQSGRKRSASLTSLREEDFKTMDPASKFITPRPAKSPPEASRRIGTAPLRPPQQQKRPSRSVSPGSSWIFSPWKLFSRKSSSSSLLDAQVKQAEDERSVRSDGSRSRDISPESLRKFLVDDGPLDHEHDGSDRPAIDIPEDIVEENEDDDNFATSAVSETMQFTGLSPPPQRALSPAIIATVSAGSAAAFSASEPHFLATAMPTRSPPGAPPPSTLSSAAAKYPSLLSASTFYSPPSPESFDSNSPPAFYHSDSEEEDDDDNDDPFSLPSNSEDENDSLPLQGVDADADAGVSAADGFGLWTSSPSSPSSTGTTLPRRNFAAAAAAVFSTYSLPQTAGAADDKLVGAAAAAAAAAGGGARRTQRQQQQQQPPPSLLASSPTIPDAAGLGLGELVGEWGWMAGLV